MPADPPKREKKGGIPLGTWFLSLLRSLARACGCNPCNDVDRPPKFWGRGTRVFLTDKTDWQTGKYYPVTSSVIGNQQPMSR